MQCSLLMTCSSFSHGFSQETWSVHYWRNALLWKIDWLLRHHHPCGVALSHSYAPIRSSKSLPCVRLFLVAHTKLDLSFHSKPTLPPLQISPGIPLLLYNYLKAISIHEYTDTLNLHLSQEYSLVAGTLSPFSLPKTFSTVHCPEENFLILDHSLPVAVDEVS